MPVEKIGWKQKNVFGICQPLSTDDTKPPFAYLLADQEYSQKINCVFGNAPLESDLGYQLTDSTKTVLTFPDIPLPSTESFNPPDFIPPELLHKMKVTGEEACELYKRKQFPKVKSHG